MLERFVKAVESIAASLETMANTKVGCCDKVAPSQRGDSPEMIRKAEEFAKHGYTRGADPAPAAMEEPPESIFQTVVEMEREDIKKMLVEKDVEFKPAARTETLQKLLVDVLEKEAAPEETPDDVFGDEPPAPSEPEEDVFATEAPAGEEEAPPTIDDVREALTALAAAKSKEVAMTVLHTYGDAERLSQVPPGQYKRLIDECNKEAAK